MHDPHLVRGLQRLGGLQRNRQRLLQWQRATSDPVRQRRALDQFQHEDLVSVLSSRP